jgi:hypothetical protein
MKSFNFSRANIKTDKRKKRMTTIKKQPLIKPELQQTELFLLNLFWPNYKSYDYLSTQENWNKFNNFK